MRKYIKPQTKYKSISEQDGLLAASLNPINSEGGTQLGKEHNDYEDLLEETQGGSFWEKD